MLQKLVAAYKLWHVSLGALPRLARFTIGAKIDMLFTQTIEAILAAGYTPRIQKNEAVRRASAQLDTLKFFIQLAWEVQVIDHKKYAALIEPLVEIGKMIGGWQKYLDTHAPANAGA